jgi:hypothetical protein
MLTTDTSFINKEKYSKSTVSKKKKPKQTKKKLK